jgi:uncharacterized protein DUF4372
MVKTASIFSQLLNFFPQTEFTKIVKKHGAERDAKASRARLSLWFAGRNPSGFNSPIPLADQLLNSRVSTYSYPENPEHDRSLFPKYTIFHVAFSGYTNICINFSLNNLDESFYIAGQFHF